MFNIVDDEVTYSTAEFIEKLLWATLDGGEESEEQLKTFATTGINVTCMALEDAEFADALEAAIKRQRDSIEELADEPEDDGNHGDI